MLYWRMFYTVVLDVTPATWCLIGAPFIVLMIMVLLARREFGTTRSEGVWRALGRTWGRIGMFVLGAALLFYALNVGLAYLKPGYNQMFYEQLRQRTSSMGSVNIRKTLVRRAADRMEETQLKDMVTTYTQNIPPEQRLAFLESSLGSNYDSGLIEWGNLLAEDSANSSEIPRFAADTTLPFDAIQRRLFAAEDRSKLWPALRTAQWQHICKQIVKSQGQPSLANILANLVSEMDSAESMRLAREMLATQYAGARYLGARMAYEAGEPKLSGVFNFLISWITWLRGVLWLILWVCIGLTIVAQAARMRSSTHLFQLQRQ